MAPTENDILFGEYKHAGELVYIDEDKKLIRHEDERRIGRDWVNLSPDKLWNNMSNHNSQNYIKALLAQDLTTECP
jgi:hypothetical protein